MTEPDYHNFDPTYDESYILDSELECQKIDMGEYDENTFNQDDD